MMLYTDMLTNDYTDAAFQTAFQTYFAELGVQINNWDGLFQEMAEAGENYTYVLKDEKGDVTGFIQFTTMEMKSWFFTAKCGFVREFWVREDLRGHGHGSQLLALAETWLQAQGCACALLTTDTAPGFYEKHGYVKEVGIQARNKDDVYLKPLRPL